MSRLDHRCYQKYINIQNTGGTFRIGVNTSAYKTAGSTGANRVLDWRRKSARNQRKYPNGTDDYWDSRGYGTKDLPQIDYLTQYYEAQLEKERTRN